MARREGRQGALKKRREEGMSGKGEENRRERKKRLLSRRGRERDERERTVKCQCTEGRSVETRRRRRREEEEECENRVEGRRVDCEGIDGRKEGEERRGETSPGGGMEQNTRREENPNEALKYKGRMGCMYVQSQS